METYDGSFFRRYEPGSQRSARAILPHMLRSIPVASVLDVGCGTGLWLRVCGELGVKDRMGIDGHPAGDGLLEIPPAQYHQLDLARPFDLRRRFDLVISVEVAEHLPRESAQDFVASLCRHGDVILFSAAIPLQGGQHHINEAWQSYWAGLFGGHGFSPVDLIRPAVWGDLAVEPFYAQNCLVYVRSSELNSNPKLDALKRFVPSLPQDIVHPRMFESAATNPLRLGFRWAARNVIRKIMRRADTSADRTR